MKIFLNLVIILVVFFTSTSAAQTSIIGEQPLSRIAIHKAVYALSDSSSIKAYPYLLGLKVLLMPFIISLGFLFQTYMFLIIVFCFFYN